MNMRRLSKSVLATVCALASFVALAVKQVDIDHDTTGCRPGVWTSDFDAAKAYADQHHTPLLAFWGSSGCAHCATMKSNGFMKELFINWVKAKPIVLLYTEVDPSQTSTKTPVKTFTKGDYTGGNFPYMRCYWPKADGTLVSKCFSGNSKQMPVTEGLLSEQLVGTLDKYFGSWKPEPDYAGGYFSVTNLPNARLEAVAGTTKSVSIPMFRKEKAAAKNKLQINGGSLIDISWAANEVTKSYKYTIPSTAKAGASIALKLFADDGKTVKSTSAINVVAAPANAIGNPKWIGKSFAAGEWTMDLDAALKNGRKTLAFVGGDMWCPYCQGLRDGVLSKSDFVNWAKESNVNLVAIDMPQKNKTTATLLTRDEAAGGVSGAAYLSRNEIPDADAKTVFDRNKKLSGSTWLPKSSSATRLGNPTVLLLNSDKTVAARLYQANDGKAYPLQETLNRLKELLLLAGGTDKDTDPAATTKSLAIETTDTGTIQVNNRTVWYKLTNVPAGQVTFTGTCSKGDLTLSVYEYSGSGACPDAPLATGRNSLAVTFKTGSGKYLKVESFQDNTAKYGTGTARGYSVTSAVTLTPSDASASFKTTSGNVRLAVTAGKTYKLSGFSDYSAFTKNEDGTYTAKSGGTIAMTAAAGATVTFQLWQPGTVQFAASSAKAMEADGKVTVKVSRTGGASDAASFNLSVDTGSNASGRVSVSPATVSWATGDSAAKTVTLTIAVNKTFNPDETFKVTLTKASGSAVLGAVKTFSLSVTDTDDPVLASASFEKRYYRNMQIEEVFPVQNIKGGKVSLALDGKLPTGLKLAYNPESKALVLAGKPTRAASASFKVTVSERRTSGKTATGTPSTFNVIVADAAALKPGEKGYNKVIAAGGTTYGTIPVYGTLGGSKVVAGSVLVKMTKALQVTAKFTGADGSKASFSGRLGALNDGGTASAALEKGAARMTVSISTAGKATAKLTGLKTIFGSSLDSGSVGANMVHGALDAYAGYYTVTLPADTTQLAKGGEMVPTGTGYVTLKMTLASFKKSGKVSYAGMLPDGKSFTGYAYLSADHVTQGGATWAYLPLVIAKGKENAGLMLRVRKNAAKTHGDDPMVVLAADDGSVPFWSYGGIETPLNVYGAYYDQGLDLSGCCSEYYNKTIFTLTADTAYFADSTVYGKIAKLPSTTVTVSSGSKLGVKNADAAFPVKLTLTRKTGIVSGTYPVEFSGGRTVKLTVKGVLLPGWADCNCSEDVSVIERPLFSGLAFYSDRIGGGLAKRGFAVELR